MSAHARGETLLGGRRALDLTDERGFLCGRILGDLGVDVIKVEPPGGDRARNIGPFYHDVVDPERSLYWFGCNLNKRGITLDIETADGRALFKRLVEGADFVIESYPPGHMDGLGLGYQGLSAINPRVILTSITPWGQSGPYSGYKATDIVSCAMGGFMSMSGDADRPPVRISYPQSWFQGGAEAAAGTMVAYYHRETSGEGQHVEVSIQQVNCWNMMNASQIWEFWHRNQPREGAIMRDLATGVMRRGVWPCKEGHVVFLIGTGPLFGPSMQAMTEWIESEGIDTSALQVDWVERGQTQMTQEEMEIWIPPVAELFKRYTAMEIYLQSVERHIMLTPCSSAGDFLHDPQLKERGYWMEVEHPELGTTITYPGAWCQTNAAQMGGWSRAPLIGEHNEEIYMKELGLSPQELATLKGAGVI